MIQHKDYTPWSADMTNTLKQLKDMQPTITAKKAAEIVSRILKLRPALTKSAVIGKLNRMKKLAA